MGKVSDDPRVYMREAVVLADRVLNRPHDQDTALKLAVKVQALSEAFEHRAFKSARGMSRAAPKNPHIRRTLTIELTYIGSASEAVRAAHHVLDAGTLQDGMLEAGSGFQILDVLVKG